MSANDIQVVTIIVPNPEYDQSKSARIVNSNLGYAIRITNSFQTLSDNNPNNYNAVEGLLYLPTLPTNSSVCADAQSLLPDNVTTIADFPQDQEYPLTAIFPWTNSNDCTEAYLAQARADAVRGAYTFQPGVGDPPPAGDSSWGLGDGESSHWKTDNQFPIYAINSALGVQIFDQMALYSGNMSDAPNGPMLTQEYDSRDFPRLFAHVDLQAGSNVPSLWIFLIIVLAVLLGIVVLASIVMHIVQRHQRKVLQRRLERGEVDLESLGIKKMNVPQSKIDDMPKYIYTDAITAPTATAGKPRDRSSTLPQAASFSQTTCPICLDDFISNEAEVRELPCRHIFHPECIDPFLTNNSSLCPMCKTSALPPGYCPVKVTNLMVRRERLVRRMRDRRRQSVAAAAAMSVGTPALPTTRVQHASLWIQRRLRVGQGLPTAPRSAGTQLANNQPLPQELQSTTAAPASDLELGQVTTTETSPARAPEVTPSMATRRQTIAVPADIASQGSAARRAWRRERLARQQDEAYNAQAETARQVDVGRPLWRRVASRVIPGID